MTSTQSVRQRNAQTQIDNLIKNGDFSAEFLEWAVEPAGSDDCKVVSGNALLTNNGKIGQTVALDKAAPYILRFEGATNGAELSTAQILENGDVTHTIYIRSGHYKHSFVTRENTTSVGVLFTGINESTLILTDVILTRDLPDEEELIKNNHFDFGAEDWQQSGNVVFADGLCKITTAAGRAYQHISGLVVGATYEFQCDTQPLPPFYFGSVTIAYEIGENPVRIEIIKLLENTHAYSYQYQAQSETLTIELTAFSVAYDSISLKRISVAK